MTHHHPQMLSAPDHWNADPDLLFAYNSAPQHFADADSSTTPAPRMLGATNRHEHEHAIITYKALHLSRAKLKASSRTSALISGFAMVAMVEIQLTKDNPVPEALLITFAIVTTLLVAVHLVAVMISTCILPHIEAVSSVPSRSLMADSPHKRMRFYIELAWSLSTVFGLVLFLLEIAILSWVKFYGYSRYASVSSTLLLVPVLIVFLAFAAHFYRVLVAHSYAVKSSTLAELEAMANELSPLDMDVEAARARSRSRPMAPTPMAAAAASGSPVATPTCVQLDECDPLVRLAPRVDSQSGEMEALAHLQRESSGS